MAVNTDSVLVSFIFLCFLVGFVVNTYLFVSKYREAKRYIREYKKTHPDTIANYQVRDSVAASEGRRFMWNLVGDLYLSSQQLVFRKKEQELVALSITKISVVQYSPKVIKFITKDSDVHTFYYLNWPADKNGLLNWYVSIGLVGTVAHQSQAIANLKDHLIRLGIRVEKN